MRETKFRGKRIDNGKWVYGYYVKADDKHFIVKDNSPILDYGSKVIQGLVEVDPKTVGQFTGRCENSKDVYGGDICIINETEKAFVEWDNNEGGFVWRIIGKKSFWSWHWAKIVEIISNVHDNPKLLERM